MAGLRDKLPLLLGAKTAKALATSLDIETVSDLLRHYPRRYAERGELTDIAGLELGEHATVLARIEKVSKRRMKARNGTIIDMVITDGKRRLTCAFFNQAWREKDLVPGKTGLFAGKVSAFRDTLQLTNPEYELFDAENEAEAMDNFLAAIIPVYPAAQGMPTWSIAKCVRQVLDVLEVDDDPMPAELRRLHKLSDLDNALRGIHRPENWAHLEASKKRLKWDEAMAVQLIFAQRRHSAISRPAKANPHVSGGLMEAFDKRLPFDLTAGQRGIGDEIAADLASEHPMNRLLQGEVGSGKTVVALRAMLQVVDNGTTRRCATARRPRCRTAARSGTTSR
ncbi:ATP-dependent DNA helicase RecG, partial [Amycolatopsis mediterranei]